MDVKPLHVLDIFAFMWIKGLWFHILHADHNLLLKYFECTQKMYIFLIFSKYTKGLHKLIELASQNGDVNKDKWKLITVDNGFAHFATCTAIKLGKYILKSNKDIKNL